MSSRISQQLLLLLLLLLLLSYHVRVSDASRHHLDLLKVRKKFEKTVKLSISYVVETEVKRAVRKSRFVSLMFVRGRLNNT